MATFCRPQDRCCGLRRIISGRIAIEKWGLVHEDVKRKRVERQPYPMILSEVLLPGFAVPARPQCTDRLQNGMSGQKNPSLSSNLPAFLFTKTKQRVTRSGSRRPRGNSVLPRIKSILSSHHCFLTEAFASTTFRRLHPSRRNKWDSKTSPLYWERSPENSGLLGRSTMAYRIRSTCGKKWAATGNLCQFCYKTVTYSIRHLVRTVGGIYG